MLTYPHGLRERRTPVLYDAQSNCPDDKACSRVERSTGADGSNAANADGRSALNRACARPTRERGKEKKEKEAVCINVNTYREGLPRKCAAWPTGANLPHPHYHPLHTPHPFPRALP